MQEISSANHRRNSWNGVCSVRSRCGFPSWEGRRGGLVSGGLRPSLDTASCRCTLYGSDFLLPLFRQSWRGEKFRTQWMNSTRPPGPPVPRFQRIHHSLLAREVCGILGQVLRLPGIGRSTVGPFAEIAVIARPVESNPTNSSMSLGRVLGPPRRHLPFPPHTRDVRRTYRCSKAGPHPLSATCQNDVSHNRYRTVFVRWSHHDAGCPPVFPAISSLGSRGGQCW